MKVIVDVQVGGGECDLCYGSGYDGGEVLMDSGDQAKRTCWCIGYGGIRYKNSQE